MKNNRSMRPLESMPSGGKTVVEQQLDRNFNFHFGCGKCHTLLKGVPTT